MVPEILEEAQKRKDRSTYSGSLDPVFARWKKYADHQKNEFAKGLSAIANTPGGRGYIIVGVDDSCTPRGVVPRADLKER
jgi:hypothetical protein